MSHISRFFFAIAAGIAVYVSLTALQCIGISTRWQCNIGYECCATVEVRNHKKSVLLVCHSVNNNNVLLLSPFNQQSSTNTPKEQCKDRARTGRAPLTEGVGLQF